MTDTAALPDIATAVLDATRRVDDSGRVSWPLSAVTSAIGARAPHDVLAQLPGTGPASVDRVEVRESTGGDVLHTYIELRLSALAAYIAAASLLGPDSAVRRYFADRLAAEGGGAASSADVDADARDRPLYLSDFLVEVTGDADYADRYRSAFGKAVKAAHIEAHGTPPPVETVDVDGREAQVCQYTEADRDLIAEVWEGFRRFDWSVSILAREAMKQSDG
ncbi:hypothetical protein H7J07_04955 [Mycobacterium koreense]|uniref:Uncharacterized protein n=1 Tax=Mycolicibacillus koreensis TaxID=1069220 RepID=A0A7I7SD83_9MYCO|nr:hypothetical protein [Mycolicibacillus koreensis]MCV7247607.1 hypothetical protein [Mycolicibacillus koreensis]OSC32818.1 hypothetical protein B8W67_13950 [Mycolicibacillus koreensis]BBY53985.1 hypothetical protein MKOR_12360 [Mycolicibacillus koreensis]